MVPALLGTATRSLAQGTETTAAVEAVSPTTTAEIRSSPPDIGATADALPGIRAADTTADAPSTHRPADASVEIGSFYDSNAIVVNVTEADLNRILQGSLHAWGGPEFAGSKLKFGKGLSDLRYHVSVSEPVLRLGPDGEAVVTFSIREARLDIGRYERTVGKRLAYCENLGVTVDPDRPVEVTLGLRFAIEGENLRIIPTTVSIPDAEKNFHLVKPTRCRNGPLPTWLLWWIGKSRLRHRLGTLDDVLLSSAQKSASKMDGDLLWKQWELGTAENREDGGSLYLHPGLLDTSRGALFMSLAASDSPRDAEPPRTPDWAADLADRSFLAVSEPFLDAASGYALSRISSLPRKPSGNMAKLLKSDAVCALIPGLRTLESKDELFFAFKLGDAPRVELRRIASLSSIASPSGDGSETRNAPTSTEDANPDRAVIAIHVSNLELGIWRAAEGGDVHLGSLKIDSGDVALAPYANPLGGISFELVENQWTVSSSGIEFDEELVAATIQELIFGEAFETRYAPLLRSGLGIGDARLVPRAFRVIDNHLVIEFAGL